MDSGEIGAALPCDELNQRVENGLQIVSRPADDLEDIGGSRLLLQHFLQLMQQARIIDGDDGLSGKVLYDPDLLAGERPDDLAANRERTHELVILEQRHRQRGAHAAKFHGRYGRRIAGRYARSLARSAM